MDYNPRAETEGRALPEMLHLSNRVATSLQGRLNHLSSLSTECCIYRVPEKLRKVKENAYEPILVSIGPLHHGKKRLIAMEEYKLRCLENFLFRFEKTLEECVQAVSKMEKDARDCYIENINMISEDFVTMVLVDSCFIIEVILCYFFPDIRDENDRIYKKPWLITDVRRDLTLLENQLPFFVVQSLYYLAYPEHVNDCTFLTLSLEFFRIFLQMPDIGSAVEMNDFANKIFNEYEVKHFVDLLRICHLPTLPRSQKEGDQKLKTMMPSAIELHEAGVRLKMGSEDRRLLDVSYKTSGVLEIPKLILQDTCEPLFRNLIAFEMCHCQEDTYITDYIYLMDRLINTTGDVDLLVKLKIIDNWMGDSVAVMNLFNNLLIDATLWGDNFYFTGVFEGLAAYCQVPWHSWQAKLKHDYFSSPWRGASTIAAIILLGLTFIQTVYSGLSAK